MDRSTKIGVAVIALSFSIVAVLAMLLNGSVNCEHLRPSLTIDGNYIPLDLYNKAMDNYIACKNGDLLKK